MYQLSHYHLFWVKFRLITVLWLAILSPGSDEIFNFLFTSMQKEYNISELQIIAIYTVIFIFLFDNLLKIKYKFIQSLECRFIHIKYVSTDAISVRFFLNYPLYCEHRVILQGQRDQRCRQKLSLLNVLIPWTQVVARRQKMTILSRNSGTFPGESKAWSRTVELLGDS